MSAATEFINDDRHKTARLYTTAIKDLEGLDPSQLYARVTQGERDTLEVLNRVVNHERRRRVKERGTKFIPDLSLSEMLRDGVTTLVSAAEEATKANSPSEFLAVLVRPKTLFYIGVCTVIAAVLLMIGAHAA